MGGSPYWSLTIKHAGVISSFLATSLLPALKLILSYCVLEEPVTSLHVTAIPRLDKGYLVSPRLTLGACWAPDAVWY